MGSRSCASSSTRRLNPVDEQGMRETFLDAIGASPGSGRIMALQWRAGGPSRVERHAPVVGRTGKILHLHHGGAARIDPTGARP